VPGPSSTEGSGLIILIALLALAVECGHRRRRPNTPHPVRWGEGSPSGGCL
jgi:hypothetical protein